MQFSNSTSRDACAVRFDSEDGQLRRTILRSRRALKFSHGARPEADISTFVTYLTRFQVSASTVPIWEAGLVYSSSSAVIELMVRFFCFWHEAAEKRCPL